MSAVLGRLKEALHMQIKIYEDDDGVRRSEIEKLGGNNQFSMFYERLKEIKEYHRRHPTNEVTAAPDDEAAICAQVLTVLTVAAVPSVCTCLLYTSPSPRD